jgi:hypothetical protein
MSLKNDLNGGCVMRPVECRELAAQCRRMAEGEPNLRVQAILTDMARTWDRLAIEAEISQGKGASLGVTSQLSRRRAASLSARN